MADNNIKGLTIEFNADTSKFKSQMNRFNKDLSETRKESKALSDSLKFEWNPDKFLKAQDTAKKAIEKTEEKAQVLRDRLKAMEEHGIRTDKQKAELQKWQTELAYTEKSLGYLQNELKKLNNVKMEHLQKQFTDLGEKISKAGNAMKPISALAAGVVGGLTAMGASAMKSGGELDDMAMKMDMTAESYQKLSYVAAQTGSDISRIERSFTLLRDTMGKALTGETNKSTEALQKLGFAFAEETAVGAKLVTQEYKRLLKDNSYRNFITSACPSVNYMIQMYYPKAIPFLAPIDSPMVAHGKIIKQCYPDAKVVFIGPCIAKKKEGFHSDVIDGVLTFEDLDSMFKENNIDLNEQDIEPCINDTHNKAKFYPISRGIIK